ncbi:MAG: glycosyltransferase, partial [Actinomycetota bacterium]|nr:glycosyltransferase [Actinomycetota bacterium]
VIAPTRLTRDMLLRNGIKPNLLRVSRYGIETSRISSVPQSPENPETVRFGFMGGLVRHKGVHNLVKAFRLNPRDMKAELKIYGDPERAPEYFSEIEDLAGDDPRIIFPGAFEGAKVGEVLPEIDVLVVPSAWYENTPLVVYEAFASGTPVVATNLGGLSEVIEHGKNGLLFAVDDVEDMSTQLTRFLEEPDLISRLREGIEPVRTVAESADDLEQVYREVIEARRSRKPERRGPLRSSGRTPPAAER